MVQQQKPKSFSWPTDCVPTFGGDKGTDGKLTTSAAAATAAASASSFEGGKETNGPPINWPVRASIRSTQTDG